jgi:hypothetical protein
MLNVFSKMIGIYKHGNESSDSRKGVNYLDQANSCPVKAIEYGVDDGLLLNPLDIELDDRHSITATFLPTDTGPYPSPRTLDRGGFSHSANKVIR